MNLPLKNPIKNHENTKKIAKSITNQQNPYQYEHIKTHQRYQNTEKPITNQVINVQKKIQIHQQFEIQDLLGKRVNHENKP